MDNKRMFKDFGSVADSEVLDQQQMDALEAGGNCESGCKKACMPGRQNTAHIYDIQGPVDTEEVNKLK